MKAVTYQGMNHVEVSTIKAPEIQDPEDVIVALRQQRFAARICICTKAICIRQKGLLSGTNQWASLKKQGQK